MKKTLKNSVTTYFTVLLFSCTITAMVAAAISYFSNSRQNDFSPAIQDILIEENDSTPEPTQTKELTFSLNDDYYTVDKKIEINNPYADKNQKPNDNEYVRVKLIPSWIDSNGKIYANLESGNLGKISDFYSQSIDGNNLNVCDHFGTVIITYVLNNLWSTEWTYNENDGCFYHKGIVTNNSTASKLIESVKISKDVYDSTAGYQLQVDVLADAIQIYGEPLADRDKEWQKAKQE